jgi:phage shock protein A
MSLFSRAHDILAAKANKALDSVENPNEMLDYSYVMWNLSSAVKPVGMTSAL